MSSIVSLANADLGAQGQRRRARVSPSEVRSEPTSATWPRPSAHNRIGIEIGLVGYHPHGSARNAFAASKQHACRAIGASRLVQAIVPPDCTGADRLAALPERS